MNKPKLKAQRLAVLFALGCLLFNFPLLALFNRSETVGSVPLLYLYVYAAWALLIGLLTLVIERK
jgi:predicted permease